MLKKYFLQITVFLMLISLLIIAFFLRNDNNEFTKTEFLLNTFVTVSVYDKNGAEYAQKAMEICRSYNNMLDVNNTESLIYKLNNANGAPVIMPDEIIALIKTAVHYSEVSGGLFDITIEPVSTLYDFNAKTHPSEEQINAALTAVGYENIVISGNTISLKNGAQITLGAIAKGFITDKIGIYLQELKVNALINLGGNVMCIGKNPNGNRWNVGIQKPFSESGDIIKTVMVTNQSVVTSGVYERYFYENGDLYHHILNPCSGKPINNGLYSVTIICENSTKADALSTACFAAGLEKGMEIAQTEGVSAIFITNKNEIIEFNGYS